MPEQVNRRTAKRFPMQVPITIWDVGGRAEMSGLTRDVSSGGVFFLIESWPSRSRPFQFMLTLPGSETGSRPDIPVYCEGNVVRSEKRGAREVGVAIRIERYQVGGLRPPIAFAS